MIDSHAHLTSDAVYSEIDVILQRAQEACITHIVNICTNEETLIRGLTLAKIHPWIHNAAATTPHDTVKEGNLLFPLMEKHARSGDLCAVGETGLDYYYFEETKEQQKKLFIRYLHLALDSQLPIIIHCRDAFADFFEIIDSEYRNAPGVLHCFTGTMSEAQEVIKLGWYLSLSGIVTYKKSEELRDVAKIVPLDQLLIETDTPYLAPQSHRGKRNEPSYLIETAQVIANERGIPLEELTQQTSANAKKFFRI